MHVPRALAGLAGRRLSYILNNADIWCGTKRNLVAVIPRWAARPVSRIAFCSGVRFDVPQEEGPNQDSELELSASPIPQATTRRLSPLHLLSSSVGRVVLGVLCVEPRITSYALDRSFRYILLRIVAQH